MVLIAGDLLFRPDLNVVWTQTRPGYQWFETRSDSNGDLFDVLHPRLGLTTEGQEPIVILEEYKTMWAALQLMHRRQLERSFPKPPHGGHSRLFFVGHPGIGKTLFLLYALARACSENQPIAIGWSQDTLYYFDGTANVPVEIDLRPLRKLDDKLSPTTFILWDSSKTTAAPPMILQKSCFCVAIAASPSNACWHWAVKDQYTRFFHVRLPSVGEIRRISKTDDLGLAKFLPLIGQSPRRLEQFLDYNSVKLEYEQIARTLALNPNILREVTMMDSTDVDDFDAFFFMEPRIIDTAKTDDLSGRLTPFFRKRHTIGTLWQHRLLRRAFLQTTGCFSSELLLPLSSRPLAFGLTFESITLNNIQLGRVHHSFQLLGRPSPASLQLPCSPLAELAPGYYLTLTGDLPPLDPSSSYFIPVDLSFPTIDAVIITPTEVTLLQLAICKRHSVKEAGIHRVHDLIMGSGGREWRYLFVVASPEYGQELAASPPSIAAVSAAKSTLGVDLRMGFLHPPLRSSSTNRIIELQVQDSSPADDYWD
ncbi:hypothetical protein C8J57DRAFT_1491648 [Mycena rebaudengoi]|nr:hypothetical protein C8J57DRAFT_1491648 [Mycena rebaudengoi]